MITQVPSFFLVKNEQIIGEVESQNVKGNQKI